MDKNQLTALINAVEGHEDFVLFQKVMHGQQLAEVYQELVTMYQSSEQPQEEPPIREDIPEKEEKEVGVSPHDLLEDESEEEETPEEPEAPIPPPPPPEVKKPFRVKLRQ